MENEIKSLRIGAGMTQEELAKKVGVSHISVSRWERGEALPSPKNVKAMSKIFDIDGKSFFLKLITTKVDKNTAF